MALDIKIVEEARKPLAMHPKKFALWIFIASVIMIFAALTSAYIVRQADGNWHEFDMPRMFWVNTVIILISSITLHWAYLSAKRDNPEMVKLALSITTILGLAFLVGQYFAWNELIANNVHFIGKDASWVSGSFLYVISGLHWAHVISGVIVLIVATVAAFKYKVHSKNMTQMEMCATYWHFLDVLWLYLFVFLLLNR
jgi:cytochrome c oxidase subunit III